MKYFIYSLLFISLFTNCSASDDERFNNPYLVDINMNFQIHLDFAEYNQLNFPGNHYSTYNYGIKGVVIYNVNNDLYLAYELSDPNLPPGDCTVLTVDGLIAKSQCEDANEYNIVTGELVEGEGEYAMKPYRVEKNGNVLTISN